MEGYFVSIHIPTCFVFYVGMHLPTEKKKKPKLSIKTKTHDFEQEQLAPNLPNFLNFDFTFIVSKGFFFFFSEIPVSRKIFISLFAFCPVSCHLFHIRSWVLRWGIGERTRKKHKTAMWFSLWFPLSTHSTCCHHLSWTESRLTSVVWGPVKGSGNDPCNLCKFQEVSLWPHPPPPLWTLFLPSAALSSPGGYGVKMRSYRIKGEK